MAFGKMSWRIDRVVYRQAIKLVFDRYIYYVSQGKIRYSAVVKRCCIMSFLVWVSGNLILPIVSADSYLISQRTRTSHPRCLASSVKPPALHKA